VNLTHLRPVPRSKNAWSFVPTPPIRLHGVVLKLSTGTTTLFQVMSLYSVDLAGKMIMNTTQVGI